MTRGSNKSKDTLVALQAFILLVLMYGEHIECPSTPCATATTTATHLLFPSQSAEPVLPPPSSSSSLLPAVWISFGVSLCALYAWLNARLHCGDARSTGSEGGELFPPPPRFLSLAPLPPSGDDASRKDHYWNSCHPHPLPLSSPLSRNWGRQQPAGQKVKRGPLEQRKRGRDKSGVWIRAGGAGKEEAIRLESSTAMH